MIKERTKTISDLKKFKYFELFHEYEDHENNIYGYFVDVTSLNKPFIKSFIRYMFPNTSKDKNSVVENRYTIFIQRMPFIEYLVKIDEIKEKDYSWIFKHGFNIQEIIEFIRIKKKRKEMQMEQIESYYIRMRDFYSIGTQIAPTMPIIDHLNLIT